MGLKLYSTSVTTDLSSNLFCSIKSFNLLHGYFETSQCCTPIVIGTLTTMTALFFFFLNHLYLSPLKFLYSSMLKRYSIYSFQSTHSRFCSFEHSCKNQHISNQYEKECRDDPRSSWCHCMFESGTFCVNVLLHGGDWCLNYLTTSP